MSFALSVVLKKGLTISKTRRNTNVNKLASKVLTKNKLSLNLFLTKELYKMKDYVITDNHCIVSLLFIDVDTQLIKIE